jgi:hypothetical protein
MYQAGHKQAGTTSRYIHSGMPAQRRMLESLGEVASVPAAPTPTQPRSRDERRPGGPSTPSPSSVPFGAILGANRNGAEAGAATTELTAQNHSCEGEDLNLHGSYPTSTSRNPDGPETPRKTAGGPAERGTREETGGSEWTLPGTGLVVDRELQAEASELLELAARQVPISRERAERFVRDLLMAWPMGAAALAVLDGDRFAGARLVDLAVQVLGAAPGSSCSESADAAESRAISHGVCLNRRTP